MQDAGIVDRGVMLLDILSPYLDTWDTSAQQEVEDSEFVAVYDDTSLSGDPNDDPQRTETRTPLPRSETAADAMSVYIEIASVEKSRLSEFVNMFLPSHRYSCQAYSERYCWSRYFEIVSSDDECGMQASWERGIADGNRDIRSRLVTMPCNPQFKRYIPKYLDHGNDPNRERDTELAASKRVDLIEEDLDLLNPLNTSLWPRSDIVSAT